MSTRRMIEIVRQLISNAIKREDEEEVARLGGLLMILQADYISELEATRRLETA